MEQQENRPLYIPPNFKEGTSVMGFMVRPLYAIQAVPWVLLMALVFFLLLRSWSLTAKIVGFAVTSIPVIFLCIVGLNGDSVYRFIRNAVHSNRTRRICLYNPRIKTEIKPLAMVPLNEQMQPGDRILAFIEKMKKEKEDKQEEVDLTNLYFQDDEGIVEKPIEYMTPKERRAYLRNQQD